MQRDISVHRLVSCDIFAQPVEYTNEVSRTCLEALASGLPVVVSETDRKEITDPAVLTVKNDPKEFRKAFEKILAKDGLLKKKMIKNGLEIIESISKTRMIKKEVDIYKKLIDEFSS